MPNDDRNRFPQWGPLRRIWRLLDEDDIRRALESGLPPEAAKLAEGATRGSWTPFVHLESAPSYGFEPVIGWRNVAGILGHSEKTIRLGAKRSQLPIYRAPQPAGRSPSVVAPLCQLVRWAEARLGWDRREGW